MAESVPKAIMQVQPSTHADISYRFGDSFFGRLGGSNLFAWVISIGLHLLIFLGFYQTAFRQESEPQVLIIPEARLVEMAGPGGPEAPVSPRNDARPPEPVKVTPLPAPQQTSGASEAPPEDLPLLAVTLDEPLSSSDDGPRTQQLPSQEVSIGEGLVASIGSSSAGGSGTGMVPVSVFFGQTGNAYKVVYVVDVSASLMIYMDEIVRQMRESIRALLPSQQFHIVLAKPGEVVELSQRRLVPAIGRYKAEAMSFLEQIDRIPRPGKADPIGGMKRAFAVRPELIYFLSDGDYADIQTDLELSLHQLNPKQQVKITTLGFDPSPGPKALLERIARRHGGRFRAVEMK